MFKKTDETMENFPRINTKTNTLAPQSETAENQRKRGNFTNSERKKM